MEFEEDGANEVVNTWERPFERSWDVIQEDENGQIKSLKLQQLHARKKRLASFVGADEKSVEKGIIRFLNVIVDFSQSMDYTDLKPNRRDCTLTLLEQFIKQYFDQNPISELGFIFSHHAISQKITELSGNPLDQASKLLKPTEKGGEFSLQNALMSALSSLRHVPPYGTREVLVLMGSVSTSDPSDIASTIAELKKENIRCSVIGLAAEMHVCRLLTKTTGGQRLN